MGKGAGAGGRGRALRRLAPASLLLAALGLSLLVAAFAHGFAQFRHGAAAEPVVEMVICAGEMTQTILIDTNGDPVKPSQCPPELCRACLAASLQGLAPHAAMLPRAPAPHRTSFFAMRRAAAVARPASDPRPRGPPVTT
jgi:hypothetical protein